VVSTGAAIALSFLPLARTLGIPAYYVESAARRHGPSTTGRLLARVPGLSLYTQHASWADGRWNYAGCVFDGYEARERRFPTRAIRRAVVTLGTQPGYGFRRLVERLVDLLPPDADVLWQTGATDVRGLPIAPRTFVPGDELATAMRGADVVVAHAGVGSALCALDAGRCPVLVPRTATEGEHVDDHQSQIAATLDEVGLAVASPVERLGGGQLLRAAARVVAPRLEAGAFRLRPVTSPVARQDSALPV